MQRIQVYSHIIDSYYLLGFYAQFTPPPRIKDSKSPHINLVLPRSVADDARTPGVCFVEDGDSIHQTKP